MDTRPGKLRAHGDGLSIGSIAYRAPSGISVKTSPSRRCLATSLSAG